MGRFYTVSIDAVAVSATQDLFGLLATSGMAFKVHSLYLGQKTLTTAEMKQITVRRNPATATVGSGGSAATPRPHVPGDAAATVTARINDTTPQTTNGTQAILYADVWHFLNGLIWMPAPEQRPIIKPSEGLAVNMATAPSGSMTVSGSLVIEELY